MGRIECLKDEDCVSHYTSKETFLEFILPNSELRMGQITNFNDPVESLNELISHYGVGQEPYWPGVNGVDQLRRKIQESLRISCFSKSGTRPCYSMPRMWSQYGGNHEGVCIIFNIHRLRRAFSCLDSLLWCEEVDVFYMDNVAIYQYLPSIEYRDIESYIDHPDEISNIFKQGVQSRSILSCKNSDWRSENELRWIGWKGGEGQVMIDIQDSIDAVVVGLGFPDIAYKSLFIDYPFKVYKQKFYSNEYVYIPL